VLAVETRPEPSPPDYLSLTESAKRYMSDRRFATVGLSTGITAAGMPDAALWAEILAMFLGRLEFVVVIVSLLKIGRDGRLALAKE